MTRVLVTGVSGFVGAHVARALLEAGREVRALVRESSDLGNVPEEVELVQGDLRDAERVLAAVRGCDDVFHVAADYRFWARDTQELYQSNVEGTRHLTEAALKHGVRRFVHTSTVGTIGLSGAPQLCDEETPLLEDQFTSHYKRSKLLAENVVLDAVKRGLPAVVVNPSTPIGAFDRKPTPTGQIIVNFVTGRMPAYLRTGLNFVHVRDVANGHLLAANKGRIGQRYILGHENLSMLEFLTLLGKLTGRQPPRFRLPYSLAMLLGALDTGFSSLSRRPPKVPLEAVRMARHFMFFDSSKAVEELGLPQTPVVTGAADAIEWFERSGYFSGSGTGSERLAHAPWHPQH